MPKEITVRMAKASQEDRESVRKLMTDLESMVEYDMVPDEKGEIIDPCGGNGPSDSQIGSYVRRWFEKNQSSLNRVVFGFDVLLDNCCDPDKTYLDWKPEIAAALKAAGIDPGSE